MPIIRKLLDVAEGLAYLHAKHTVHGDLKGVSASSCSPSAVLILLQVQRSHQPQRPCPFDGFRLYLSCSWLEFCPRTRVAGVYTEVGCARGYQSRGWEHTGGRHLFFWHGCDRGRSPDLFLVPDAE